MLYSFALFASLALATPPIEIETGGTVRVSAMQKGVSGAPTDPTTPGVAYYQPFWEELAAGGFYDGISVSLKSGASTTDLDFAVYYPDLDGTPGGLAAVCSGIPIPVSPANIDVSFSSCTIVDDSAFDISDPNHPVLMFGYFDTVWLAVARHGTETASGAYFHVLSNSTADAIPGSGPNGTKFVGAVESGWSAFTDFPTAPLSSIRGPIISLIRD